jgi:hypothetical protein
VEGAIGIDAGMNITPSTFGLTLPTFGEVSAKVAMDAKLKAHFVVGPLSFPFRRAAIEVTGESDQHIRWRYNLKSELTGANSFKSILILKVAQEIRSAQITALLQVIPCKKSWLIFRDVLPALSDRITLPIELVTRKRKS